MSIVVKLRESPLDLPKESPPAYAARPKTGPGVRIGTVLVILLTVIATLVYVRYRHDLEAANARLSSGRLIDTRCGPIEYGDVGAGVPVLVIHGAGGGFDQGLELARPLTDQGFRVIAPSRFGYLRTPLPSDASPMAQADAYLCLLNALKVGKVAVIGASAGAPSTMQLCLRHQERCAAMVLAVPLAYNARYSAPSAKRPAFTKFLISATLSSDFIFWTMTKVARDTTINTILGTPPEDIRSASRAEQARVGEMLDHIQPISRRKLGLQNYGAIAQSLQRYDMEHVTVPTLIVSVENDGYKTYPGARYTAEHIPGARFIGYPTGGHLQVGHEEELWSEIVAFLKANSLR